MVYSAHLLVVCHGLWGQTSHIAYICRSAMENVKPSKPALSTSMGATGNKTSIAIDSSSTSSSSQTKTVADASDTRLVVLAPKLNEWTNTYDGVDICAERVLTEIDQECERIKEDGGKVEKFSIVGYSLGGLVARYVLGLLESRSPSFFDEVKPMNFTTFASPWIGVPKYESVWSNIFRFLGARLLSRSGSQLYMADRYLPSSLVDGNQQANEKQKTSLKKFFSTKEKAAPLLAVMADERYSFYKALAKFEKLDIYANTVNDRTVPFPTAAIESHDPFSLARAKAQAAAKRRDEEDQDLDMRDGGLDIVCRSDAAIIESFEQIDPPIKVPDPSKPKRRFRFKLPLLLRPTTYPFSRPVSLILIVFIPITLPLTIIFAVTRFSIQSRQSRKRIAAIRAEAGDGRQGMLARVGVGLQEVAEGIRADNPEYAAGLKDDVAETRSESGDHKKHGLSRTMSDFGEYNGTDTPPFARSGSPPMTTTSDSASGPADKKPYPTDPILTQDQVTMLKSLNALPKMKKHYVFLPASRNSHGAIVARDLSFPQHRPGTKIVDSWAREFKL